MEANSKINRRSRPRPYDLRRKVLLKNFLREQMTYIPQTRLTPAVPDSHVNFTEKSSDSSEIEEDLQDLNDENKSSSSVTSLNTQNNSNLSPEDDKNHLVKNSTENCIATSDGYKSDVKINSTSASTHKPKTSRFASLMNLRSKSKKKAIKGIIKAKKMCKFTKSPVKSKHFKTGLESLLSDSVAADEGKFKNQTSKNSFKSLFSLFKSRREQNKRTKEVDRLKQSYSIDFKSRCESTKCKLYKHPDQTSFDKCREELNKAQKLNKILQEENRLLSESLSYFMSSPSIHSPCTDQNIDCKELPDYNIEDSSTPYNYNWSSRTRVLRSKSVHEHTERKICKNTHRTRSMNCHCNHYFLSVDPTSVSTFSAESQNLNIPRIRKKSFAGVSAVSSNRVIQRRFSMPERILSENEKSRYTFRNCPRTRSLSCHISDSDFLPSNSTSNASSQEFTISRVRRKNILASLPVNTSGRVVQRRSSMPERILTENDKSRSYHQLGNVRDGSRRTPFHSLPSEAFY